MSREIMQQALEALRLVGKYTDSLTCYASTISEHEANIVDPNVQLAIAALEQELAKPEKEPMSFQTWRSRQHGDPEEIGFLQALKHAYESGQYSVSPPRKEWVGLTDEEAGNLFKDTDWVNDDWGHLSYARAIETKLKEKNT